MKLILQEYVTHVSEPVKKVYTIAADAVGAYNTIPLSIGLAKGDLIAFRGEGDPVRISAGGVDGRVLMVDSSTETGWKVAPISGSDNSVVLHNGTGTIVPGGTVVKISSGSELALATSSDTSMLFVTSEDCDDDADVVCYGTTNTICSVRCTSGAVAISDKLKVSSTNGVAEATQGDGFAKALTAKASGSTGTVDAIFIQSGFLPLTGGTVTGNVSINGSLSINNALSPSSGGTGHTSLESAGNAIINALSEGTSAANRNDYIVAQYVNGATTTTSYHRRKLLNIFKALTADDIPSLSTAKLTSGTLPAARGGTGQTSLQATRNAMGLGNTTGAVPVANGGTGATSAANACANLGAVKKSGDSVSGKLTFSSTTPIAYQGSKATNDMIRFMNNTTDTYGNGISIGGGGATIIGGGEAASSAEASTNAGEEKLILCNDGAIDIWTNCQSGVASATKKQIDTSGNFTGNAANVTGIVSIAHGGTGATTRLNALKALTNENVGTSATYFLTITDSWGKGGYSSVANAKTVLGWTKQGTATNTGTVTIPSGSKEVWVDVKVGSTGAHFSNTGMVAEMGTIWYVGGYMYNYDPFAHQGDFGCINLNVSNSGRTYQLRNVMYGGSDLKSSSTLTVYYK